MKVCRVVGTVVSTVKHRTYVGRTLLVCQPLDEHGADLGDTFLAIDHAQAGIGDRVLVNQEGNGARQVLRASDVRLPIRSVIVGIVDAVSLG